ncbi:Kunitz-type serine protease inhibitor kunitoxin-Tel1 [Clonorchis sinensis]|uniref:Kunitoxin-Tel1 n=2 Tax=Clonorchis sinensis TaxID=79923 RepID=G7YN19_CLOSI|nr:Kunitz-type serine protease inhibitor kunitoxin-Tel1 [Clonorchis sinensis]GAA54350.1 kunitoxin-Tel1 [Clonorchis sinensis]
MSAGFVFALFILSSLLGLENFETHALQASISEAFEKLTSWKKHRAVPNYCGYLPDSGPCNFRTRRFYYDKESGDCKEFTYNGCLGNMNNFESKASCKMVCID